MNITKDIFEKYLSTTISADSQIFDKIKPALDRTAGKIENCIIGEKFVRGMSLAVSDAAERFVCVDTLLTQLHQLDLVMTPTGFGVVANNTTSPASKARVDALEIELKINREEAYATLLATLCTVKGWGATEQAKQIIRTPFYSIYFVSFFPDAKDYEKWLKMKTVAVDADTEIRKVIGNAQMDDIMEKVRDKSLSTLAYDDVLTIICEIYRMQFWNSPVIDDKKRYLLQYIEDDLETFSIYRDSKEYKANHYERFQNKKDSPGYHFIG